MDLSQVKEFLPRIDAQQTVAPTLSSVKLAEVDYPGEIAAMRSADGEWQPRGWLYASDFAPRGADLPYVVLFARGDEERAWLHMTVAEFHDLGNAASD